MQAASIAAAFGSTLTIQRAQLSDASAIASVIRCAFAEFERLYTSDASAATCLPPSGVEQRIGEGPVWIALSTTSSGAPSPPFHEMQLCTSEAWPLYRSCDGAGTMEP